MSAYLQVAIPTVHHLGLHRLARARGVGLLEGLTATHWASMAELGGGQVVHDRVAEYARWRR